jgi:hypothetical protein
MLSLEGETREQIGARLGVNPQHAGHVANQGANLFAMALVRSSGVRFTFAEERRRAIETAINDFFTTHGFPPIRIDRGELGLVIEIHHAAGVVAVNFNLSALAADIEERL